MTRRIIDFLRFKLPKLVRKLKPTPRQAVKLLRYGLVLVAAGIVLVFGMIVGYAQDIPDPDKINSRAIAESSQIFDRNGFPLYEIHGEVKRTLISFDEMPDYVKWATISVEDKDFYNHRGVDFRGILRAAFRDVKSRSLTEGGSSITQQLVKNALLTRDKKIARKIKELVLTVQIEKRLSKDDILKLYLNEIPYGQNAYGIEAAARTYFAVSASDLTLAQSAYLAALPQRPSYLNPLGNNRDALDARKDFVLDSMVRQGYITGSQAQTAKAETVQFQQVRTGLRAPHFVMYIQEQLEQAYGREALQEGGLKVTTTLDYELQKMAEEAIQANKERYERFGATNAGLVAIDPKTGEILAMVGSADFYNQENQGQVNIALRPRQPGSSFKPYVYAAAFEEGYAPSTMLMDVSTVFGTVNGQPYQPGNYSNLEYGPVSMRKALAGSLNISAVKTLYLTGVRKAIDTAKKLGIRSELSADVCGLSLVLGGCEVTLLDHTAAFATFANGGVKHDIKSILKIEEGNGRMIFEQEESKGREVINPEIAYLINDVMSDNEARSFIFGANNPLTLPGRPVASKTGTTQNWRDGWTMGYTPQLAVGVWVGNMTGKIMNPGADGSIVAAPIWNAFLRNALAGKSVEEFTRPAGIVDIEVDRLTGKLPTASSPSTVFEKFASFAIPSEFDDVHKAVKVNKQTGLLATTSTPPDLVETRMYTSFRSERPNDPDWEEPVRLWMEKNVIYQYPPSEKDGNGELLLVAAPAEIYKNEENNF